MKKFICIFIVALCSLLLFGEENPNYNNGNGTIISQKNENNIIETLRKCEVDVEIGDMLNDEQRIMYDDYKTKKVVGTLQNDDKIKLLQVYTKQDNNKEKDQWGGAVGELWYKIKRNDEIAWICQSSDYLGGHTEPYYNNRYQIIEVLNSGGKNWTVRTMDQALMVYENLNIRDTPGTKGNKIIYTLRPGKTDPTEIKVEMIAMTEEVDVIDGKKDYWLKIKYKDYTGWIFGGYASVDRGGVKYYIPEHNIEFNLGWAP